MKKKLLAVFLFSATTMLCAQTLQTSNKYFEVGNFKEVHNPAWGVTDDPWCINDHTLRNIKNRFFGLLIVYIIRGNITCMCVPDRKVVHMFMIHTK